MNPIKRIGYFFMNKRQDAQATPAAGEVGAPAFSLTKVLTTGSIVLTPLVAFLVKVFEGDSFQFQPWHIVALTLGVLGFLAVAASADVIARAISARGAAAASAAPPAAETPAVKLAEAAVANPASTPERDTVNLIPFTKPLPAGLIGADKGVNIDVLAATGGAKAYFLVKQQNNGTLYWLPVEKVELR